MQQLSATISEQVNLHVVWIVRFDWFKGFNCWRSRESERGDNGRHCSCSGLLKCQTGL